MVFVLDTHKKPLMPCTPERARLLLARGRAVVHRLKPFVIRLKDRRVEDSVLQPIALKLDPGSKATGMALARVEETAEGEVHHGLHLSEVQHRGGEVHAAKQRQRNARRRRRSANLRHRTSRYENRRIPTGWLPPSLLSRVGNVLTWTARYARWVPLTRIEVERVRFDTQLLQHPEIDGVQYQRGELAGWEVRAYLLIKYEYRCAYCGNRSTAFEIDHIRPRSRGGSNRVSNLCVACHACNQAKGERTAAEWGRPEVEAGARVPLKDAGVWVGKIKTLRISAMGRGDHCRTNWTKEGFPRGYKMRHKQVRGFKTGDRVRAVVPATFKTAGIHVGRVQVRQSGSFDIETREREIAGVNAKYCQLLQKGDGYHYALA
jgi:hypothetical protein